MPRPLALVAVLSAAALASAVAAQEDQGARERGALAVRGQPAMNPPTWSRKAYDTVWKQWGLKEKPADFDARVRARYGLHPADYENNGLPMGLHESKGLLGTGIVNDCLLCHASNLFGQTVMGAPNASIDLQTFFEDVATNDRFPYKMPFQFSQGRGTIDPVNPVVFLMTFRDDDLNVRSPRQLEYAPPLSSDPPAWWLLKRKQTRDWNGGVRVNSTRIDMTNLLTPFNSAEHVKGHEKTFADIHAFVLSVEAPKYPFAVDARLAETGRGLFNESCAKCHGTYGAGGKYPNKVVSLDTLGTDPELARALSQKRLDVFNASWLAQEKDPDGTPYRLTETDGYQAPPLDGVWATAPYFHNGSVPTIEHVLNSKARPKYFTRSFGTAKDDYDQARMGWKTTVLDAAPAPGLPAHERRKIYDTTQVGRSNAGHTFGDHFTDAERRAVIEYLKTL